MMETDLDTARKSRGATSLPNLPPAAKHSSALAASTAALPAAAAGYHPDDDIPLDQLDDEAFEAALARVPPPLLAGDHTRAQIPLEAQQMSDPFHTTTLDLPPVQPLDDEAQSLAKHLASPFEIPLVERRVIPLEPPIPDAASTEVAP